MYSIIVPAYNESQRITSTLDKLLDYIRAQQWDAEIVVVNDGSEDDTPGCVRRYMAQGHPVGLVENPVNRGKGYSVGKGVLHARGDVILMCDADLSIPIQEAGKLLAALAVGADIAIGSRWLRAELQRKPQPLYRQVSSRLLNVLIRAALGLRFRDTQCGFKAFTRKAAEEIFTRQRISGWGFDAELLFLARKLGFAVQEVPVEFEHDDRSKIHLLKDGITVAWETCLIRWYDLANIYVEPAWTPAAAPLASVKADEAKAA